MAEPPQPKSPGLLDRLGSLAPQRSAVVWTLSDVVWGTLSSLVLMGSVVVALVVLKLGLRVQIAESQASHWLGMVVAVAEATLVVPVWAFAVRRRGAHWSDLGLRGFAALPGCLGSVGLFCLLFWTELLWGLALQALGWPGQPDLAPLFGQGSIGLVLVAVTVGLIAPLAEEIFFRGFVFPVLRERWGLGLGIVLNAALFALLHGTPTVFPPLFAMGVGFCLLYHYTGSLWPGVLLHASINGFSLLAAIALSR